MTPTHDSPAIPAAPPAWRLPLFVFLAVAGSVSISGFLLIAAIGLFLSSDQPATVATKRDAAVQSVNPNTGEPPSQSEAVAPAASDIPSDVVVTAEPDVEQATAEEAVGTSQPASLSPTPSLPIVSPIAQFDVRNFPTVELPGEARAFALDPLTGVVAVIGPWDQEVAFFTAEQLATGADAAEAKKLSVGAHPYSLVYAPRADGGVFVVGTDSPDNLIVIDAGTLQPLESIPLSAGYAGLLAASQNADTPYVYASLFKQKPHGWKSEGLTRLDIAALKIETIWTDRDKKFRMLSVSADGRYLYTLPDNSSDRLTRWHVVLPSEGDVAGKWKVDQTSIGRVKRPYRHDPRGAFVASGSNLYTTDVSALLIELRFDPQAFLDEQPWMAGMKGLSFVVGSSNDGRIVAEMSLPQAWLMSDTKNRPTELAQPWVTSVDARGFAAIFADSRRDGARFVLGTRRTIVNLPLDQLELPHEPNLALTSRPPERASAGVPYEFELQTVSGTSLPELLEGPAGASIEGGLLRWTPAEDNMGSNLIRVALRDGHVTRDEAWTVEVGLQSFEASSQTPAQEKMPFLVVGCSASVDGTRAVIWGSERTDDDPSNRSHPAVQPLVSRLAVLDLKTRKIIAEGSVNESIGEAIINRYGVYVSKASLPGSRPRQQLVAHLTGRELKSRGQHQLAPGLLTTIANRFLAPATDPGRNYTAAVYKLPDLDAVESELGPRTVPSETPVGRVNDGWLLAGVLWDDHLKQPQLLFDPTGFVKSYDLHSGSLADRHAALRGYVIDSPARQLPRIHPLKNKEIVFSPHVPAIVAVSSPPGKALKVQLTFSNLITADVMHRVTLRDGNWRPIQGSATAVTTTPNEALVVHNGDLLTVPLQDVRDKLMLPFRIDPLQSTFVLSTRKATRVRYTADSATRFELELTSFGQKATFKLDSSDGSFDVDLRESVPDMVKHVSQHIHDAGKGATSSERIDNYVSKVRPSYQRLTGKRPSGVPVLIRAQVVAYSKDQSMARLTHTYLVDIPRAEYDRHDPATQLFNRNRKRTEPRGEAKGR